MKKFVASFLVYFCYSLCAEEHFDMQASKPAGMANYEGIQAELVNHALKPCYVNKVNVITGEYFEEGMDLLVAGAEPLSFRRFYNHFAAKDYRLGCWRINPEASLVANFELDAMPHFASIGERDGKVFLLRKQKEGMTIQRQEIGLYGSSKRDRREKKREEDQNRKKLEKKFLTISTFALDQANDYGYCNLDENISGQTDPSNFFIIYWKENDPEKKSRFTWYGFIKDGSGRIREFKSHHRSWHKSKRFNFWYRMSKYEGYLHPEQWTPYQLPIKKERLPNGNVIKYDYTRWREDKYSPQPVNLMTITAYDRNEEKILGSIELKYDRSSWKHTHIFRNIQSKPKFQENIEENVQICVKGSDGRECNYKNSERTKALMPIVLQQAKTVSENYSFKYQDGSLLKEVDKGNKRCLRTEYDSHTQKVIAQYAPLGLNGEMLPLMHFAYFDQKTLVTNAEGAKTLYYFDEKKRITAVEKFLHGITYSIERNFWDHNNRLLENRIEDRNGNIFKKTSYQYDGRGNILKETKEGIGSKPYTIARTYSNDGYNLKLSEEDGFGKVTRFTYEPQSNRLSSEISYGGDKILKRTFFTYDSAAICIRKIVDDGSTVDPENLKNVTYRKITYAKPREQFPCYGLKEVVQEKTIDPQGKEILLEATVYTYHPSGKIEKEDHYDSNGDFRYSLLNEYDNYERLSCSTDPLWKQTFYFYDSNNNLTRKECMAIGHCTEYSYDFMDRLIEQKEWQSDGTFLLNKTEYDKLGRVIATIDPCGKKTRFEYDDLDRQIAVIYPDGAIERKEYDILGNVIKSIDAKGYETFMAYDYRGNLLHIIYPDGGEELFSYNSKGELTSSLDRNGAKKLFVYDLFGHLIETKVYASNGSLLQVLAADYNAFVKLSATDACGVQTIYTYDYAGRKLSEKKDFSKIDYAYDFFGRISAVSQGDIIESYKYDLLNRKIQMNIEDASGSLYFQKNYIYDLAGDLISYNNRKGIWSMYYNTRGEPLCKQDPLKFSTRYIYRYADHFVFTEVDPLQVLTERWHDNRKRVFLSLVKDKRDHEIQKKELIYDLNGNCIKAANELYVLIEPIGSLTQEWIYGPQNRIEEFIESETRVKRYSYDIKGRLSSIHNPNGSIVSQEYDDLGRLTRLYSSDFDYLYTYDGEGHLLSVEDQKSNTFTEYSYDRLGNVLKERLANGFSIENSYDESSRRIHQILPTGHQIFWNYQGPFLHEVIKDGVTFTYKKRDVSGNPSLVIFPAPLGQMELTWDLLERLKASNSAFHKSSLSYDCVGKVIQYAFEDALGLKIEKYYYDSLGHLLSDPSHRYTVDSMGIRRSKDKHLYEVNNLGQIICDGENKFTYDENGNLIENNTCKFSYDALNRLIAVEKEEFKFEYFYDAFHRRLSKKTYKEEKLVDVLYYLWDGQNEIGSITKEEKIKELKVLGEKGQAVFYELEGKPYLPLYDHRGSLASLVDMSKKETAAVYRYTAHGEPLSESDLSPWRYFDKRFDEETGFYYFGRQYYDPNLGQFVTRDPIVDRL